VATWTARLFLLMAGFLKHSPEQRNPPNGNSSGYIQKIDSTGKPPVSWVSPPIPPQILKKVRASGRRAPNVGPARLAERVMCRRDWPRRS
jgi:hypothetical protein